MPCIHGNVPSHCRTSPCQGSIFCWDESHNHLGKLKAYCKGCEGVNLCWIESHHNLGKVKAHCKGCQGSSLCWIEEHNNLGKQKAICKGCKGVSLCWIEEHNHLGKQKQYCKGCKGVGLCPKHLKLFCRECDPFQHLMNLMRSRIRHALEKKTKRTQEYLGCSGKFYHSYLEHKFKDGMTWENHGTGPGKWNIDHIIPLQYIDENGNPPTQEEIERRLYYTNTQPLWFEENMEKGDRFIG